MDHWEQNEDGSVWRWIGPYMVTVSPRFIRGTIAYDCYVTEEGGNTNHLAAFKIESIAMTAGEQWAESEILRNMEDLLS
jgi:hypothetical protein